MVSLLFPKKVFNYFVVALYPLLFAFSLNAQNFTSIPPAHTIRILDLNPTENLGLLSLMLQDNDGYVWFVGSGGVSIYDGHVTEPCDINFGHNKEENHHQNFSTLDKDNKGNIYLGKNDCTIYAIDPKSKAVIQSFPNTGRESENLYGVEISEEDVLYSVSRKPGDDSLRLYRHKPGIAAMQIFSYDQKEYGKHLYYAIADGMHWIQTNQAILRISADGSQMSQYRFSVPGLYTWNCINTKDRFYFYDEKTHDVMWWNSKREQPTRLFKAPDQTNKFSYKMYVDLPFVYLAHGSSFVIVDTLHKTVEDLTQQYYSMKLNEYPSSLSEDYYGFLKVDGRLIFVGTKYVYKVQDNPKQTSSFKRILLNGNSSISMRGIAEDAQHNVYASYYTGLLIKPAHEPEFRNYVLPGMAMNLYSAYSLSYRHPYLFWHSLKINTETSKAEEIIPNTIHGHITQMLDGDTLWLYKWGAPNFYWYVIPSGKLDSVRFNREAHQSLTYPEMINDMVKSTDGTNIWISTQVDGLNLISPDGKTIRHYATEKLGTTSEGGINALYIESDTMWYGCFHGLGMLNLKTDVYQVFKNPVSSENSKQIPRTVFSIVPDDKNGFYLGTSVGIVYFEKNTRKYFNLDPSHPLAKNEYNRQSAFRDSQGRYYFGTTNGLFTFLPEELNFIPASEKIREIRLYKVSVFNGKEKQNREVTSSIASANILRLKPSDTNIEFRFSVPDFEKTIYYSYRIEGLGDEWSEFTADHTIKISSLPPGDYRLEVRASSNASDIDTSTYSLLISMEEYWYRKAWVILLGSLGLSGLIAMMIRYRYQQRWKRQKELEQLRTRISADLHDDVGSILSGVAMQSQMLSYDVPDGQKKSMVELSDMSREAMERMRDTVWAIDSRKDKFENLIDRMRDFAEKNLERKNITHDFQARGIDGKKFISPEVRQNIYLIFKEAITNVIKHSNARHVIIRFSQEGNQISLLVKDDGTDHKVVRSDGQGILNMEMRAKKIGGSIRVSNEEGYLVELKVDRE